MDMKYTSSKKAYAVAAALLTTISLRAQDVDISLDSDGLSIDTEQWYENPLIWAGFVLLLVVLVLVSRSGSKS